MRPRKRTATLLNAKTRLQTGNLNILCDDGPARSNPTAAAKNGANYERYYDVFW